MKVIGRLPGEASCLSLVWAVLDRTSRGPRGFTISDGTANSKICAARSSNHPPTQLRPTATTDTDLVEVSEPPPNLPTRANPRPRISTAVGTRPTGSIMG